MNKSIKIFLKWFLGPLLAAWLFYSLYQQARQQPNLGASLALIKAVPFGREAWKFWLIIVLVFVNWGFEARKWQLLMQRVQAMSYLTAFKSVLCGVTLSLNTPNRMGEYAGRVLYVKEGHRGQSISLSMVGGMAQLIITMLMGSLGLLYLLYGIDEAKMMLHIPAYWIPLFLAGSIISTIVFLLFFFRLGWIVWIIDKLPRSARFLHYIQVLEEFDAKILLRLLVLSAWRYGVFVIQYIFMLQLMQVEQEWWPAFWLIAVMFWIMAIIPSIAIAELGIRGTIAKTLFAYSFNIVGILTVTFGIWFVNLFIPAFIGSLLILSVKSKKDK